MANNDPVPQPIDRSRCLRAMKALYVDGVPRVATINRAILDIKSNPEKAMAGGFLGVKIYSGFGDQDCDCEYGMGPRHGSIVFSIGRTRGGRDGVALGADEVYLLECVRDFGSVEDTEDNDRFSKRRLNLCDVLARMETYGKRIAELSEAVDAKPVESYQLLVESK